MINKLKIAGLIAAAMMLCMSFASCENQNDRIADTSVNDEKEVTTVPVTETQSDSNDTSDTITQPSYEIYDELEAEPTYYHAGLEGAVVTEQDGTGDYAFVRVFLPLERVLTGRTTEKNPARIQAGFLCYTDQCIRSNLMRIVATSARVAEACGAISPSLPVMIPAAFVHATGAAA